MGTFVAEKEPYYWCRYERLVNLARKGQPGQEDSELGEPDQTFEAVRDFLRRLHARGAHGYMYWNQNDCNPDLAAKYPRCRQTKNAEGDLWWVYSHKFVLMNPDPPNAWTQHLLDQLDKILTTYPELDGIFNDQVCYYNWDYSRQDGISMVDGVPVYNTRFSYIPIFQKIVPMLHAKGLVLWGNGGYTIDVSQYLDGVMAEGSLQQGKPWSQRRRGLERTRYLGLLGKPVCVLAGNRGPRDMERELKWTLVSGAQSRATYNRDPEVFRLMQDYMPFFRLLRGRQWVLADRAVVAPADVEGCAFTNPRGQGVIVLVSWHTSRFDPTGEQQNCRVRVAFERDDSKAAYLASPDRPGRYRLRPSREGPGHNVVLPLHSSASVIVFESGGCHLSLEAADLVADGPKARATAVLDNLTAREVTGELTIEAAGREHSAPCTVRPGSSATIDLDVDAPATAGGEVPVRLRFRGEGTELHEDCRVVFRLAAP